MWLGLFLYILVQKKQGRSRTKFLNLLKRSKAEAVRKIIQFSHVTVETSYQDTTVRKTYNYLTGSSGLEIWKPENFKSFALHAMISLILLPLAAPKWSRFYSFQWLIGLCNIKDPKRKKRDGFNICEIIKGFL